MSRSAHQANQARRSLGVGGLQDCRTEFQRRATDEIDLIVLDADTLGFIEVKVPAQRGPLPPSSQLTGWAGSEEEAKSLSIAASCRDRPVRFDVITLSRQAQQMELLEEAF
jgi:Holliday junction resolvase-like predicted endonuclease